jgi:tRNA-splicing endonuclease subunit Sen34
MCPHQPRSICLGIAVLVDDPSAHHSPSPQDLKLWQKERLRDARQQITLTEEKGSIEALNANRAMSENAQRKRKEREERRARVKAEAAPNNLTEYSPSPPIMSENPSPFAIEEPSDEAVVMPSAPYTVHVPASSSRLEWYTPDSHLHSTIEAGIWKYPSTLQERARCGVFRSLWEQGYYMGVGIKFGGEYLVYPGMFSFLFANLFIPLPLLSSESVVIFVDQRCIGHTC